MSGRSASNPSSREGTTQEPTRGLALAALAALLFSCMGVCARMAAREGAGWAEIGAVRAGVGALIALGVGLWSGARLRTRQRGLSWARSVFGTASATCTFFTLAAPGIGLGDVATLHATSPLFVAVLSARLLGERPSPALVAVLLGAFVGVSLVLGPQLRTAATVASVAVLAAVFSALAMIMVRRLRTGEEPDGAEAIALHFSLVAFVTLTALAAPTATVPTALGAAWMLGTGASAGLAQLAMTRAYAHAEAARVGAVSYLGVLVTHGLSIALLGEAPRAVQLLGALVVVGAGVAVAWDSARRTSPAASER